MMSEIYGEAGQVLVWLGEDESLSTSDFDRSLNVLLEQCHARVDDFRQVLNLYEAVLSPANRPSGRNYFMDSKKSTNIS